MAAVDWGKVIPAVLALAAGSAGGGFVTNGYNSDEHQLVLEAEQSKWDSQTAAHERAMAALRADHTAALDRAMAGYNASLQAVADAMR